MLTRDYKIKRVRFKVLPHFFARLLVLAIFSSGFFVDIICAGSQENQITLSTLKKVTAIAKKTKSLELFGKSTMAESALILDLGLEAVPGLIQVLQLKKGEWKTRFWVVDMLGYLGDATVVYELYKIAKSPQEKVKTRKQACQSLRQIASRDSKNEKWIIKKVKKAERLISSSRF